MMEARGYIKQMNESYQWDALERHKRGGSVSSYRFSESGLNCGGYVE
jgi:hypothetical protein